MFGEYKVNRCTRQCHTLGRPLGEGEWYYSVIAKAGEGYVRRDYSAECWSEPPKDAIGWWKKRMPKSDEKKMVLAPPEILVDLVRQMEQFPAKAKSRFLLTLMLMRRRIVRPMNQPADQPGNQPGQDSVSQEKDQTTDRKMMSVEVVSDGSVIEVQVCEIGRRESETLRDELNELLYCEASPEDGDDDEIDA